MSLLNNIKLYMLDLDGTFYLDEELLPGAKAFIGFAHSKGARCIFLTNNSSKSPQDYISKLSRLGVEITREDIFTSADATLLYLEEHAYKKRVLLVGTPSLERQFVEQGYTLTQQGAACVVLGFDTGITYTKLTALCDAVRGGLDYIATHPDLNCPVKGGFIPDIGAVIAFVKAATQREPDIIIGKPNAYIARAAAARYNVKLGEICMVGDRLYTDIALGACGCATALVLCGETNAQQLANSDIVPDIIADNLEHLASLLGG